MLVFGRQDIFISCNGIDDTKCTSNEIAKQNLRPFGAISILVEGSFTFLGMMNLAFKVVSLALAYLPLLHGQDHRTWVVVVATSRYWFNYRHTANGALVYQAVKTLGVPDDHIILMNALDVSNDARNPNAGYVHYDEGYSEDMWSTTDITDDYTQEETSRQTFLDVLTDRMAPHYAGRNRLKSDANSTILIYMTGHGGDEFFKFHDSEELSAHDLALALHEMHIKRRYKEILLVLDTCQATTMANYITAPNVVTLASSVKGENSYAYPTTDTLGVAIADRFTHSLYSFLTSNTVHSKTTAPVAPQLRPRLSLKHLHASFNRQVLHSTATIVLSPQSREPKDIMLADYFSASSETKHDARVIEESASAGEAANSEGEFLRRRQVVENLLSQ